MASPLTWQATAIVVFALLTLRVVETLPTELMLEGAPTLALPFVLRMS